MPFSRTKLIIFSQLFKHLQSAMIYMLKQRQTKQNLPKALTLKQYF